MNQLEAIKLGREWIENAPSGDGSVVGPDAMTGPAGCVCRACCRRISARGCNLKLIASTPLWEASPADICNLCTQPLT